MTETEFNAPQRGARQQAALDAQEARIYEGIEAEAAQEPEVPWWAQPAVAVTRTDDPAVAAWWAGE